MHVAVIWLQGATAGIHHGPKAAINVWQRLLARNVCIMSSPPEAMLDMLF
jgi:hypothetical protein